MTTISFSVSCVFPFTIITSLILTKATLVASLKTVSWNTLINQDSDATCKKYITSYWSGVGDILEMFYVALSAAVVTNSSFIVPNDWDAASVHMKKEFKSRYSRRGYEGLLYHLLNLPSFRKWSDISYATKEKIQNVPFDYIYFQPHRMLNFPCNSVLSVNLYSCKTFEFRVYPTSKEEYGENCLYQHSSTVHETVRPLLQDAWLRSTDRCRIDSLKSTAVGLVDDRVNIIWHLRTGDICLKCDDTQYFRRVLDFILKGLKDGLKANHILVHQHNNTRVTAILDVLHAKSFDSMVIEDVVCLFLRADILVATGSIFPTAIAQFAPALHPIVLAELNKDALSSEHRPYMKDAYLINPSSGVIHMENGNIKAPYQPDDLQYLLQVAGVIDRIKGATNRGG